MLPTSIALIDDDPEYAEYLGHYLAKQDVQVRTFPDSNDLLVAASPYEFDFYLVDLTLPGVDGVELIRLLRRRTSAGILVISGRSDTHVFDQVMVAGADMYLAKPVRFEQVELAIRAIQRRLVSSRMDQSFWKLDRQHGDLIAPDGTRISLSGTDLAVMECLLAADGAIVTKAELNRRLGRPTVEGADNGLNATIYRLRRRIEQATPVNVPLHSQSRVGYQFRAKLVPA